MFVTQPDATEIAFTGAKFDQTVLTFVKDYFNALWS